MYLQGVKLSGMALEEYYTPVSASWWQQRLMPSKISSVIHALIDELAPLHSMMPEGKCFSILCTPLSAHTTDDKAMGKIGSLFDSKTDDEPPGSVCSEFTDFTC